MNTYLTINDRVIIEHEKRHDLSIRAIARKLNKPKSTIAYELKKIKGYRYMSGDAQKITDTNLKQRGSKITVQLHADMLDYIDQNYDKRDRPLKKLVQAWRKNHPESPSLATIYNWLPKGIFSFPYEQILKPRKKRNKTIKRWKRMLGTPINQREIDFPNRRNECGHWEGDLIVGSNTNKKGFVLTLIEQKSRFGITKLITSKNAISVLNDIKDCIAENNQYPFKSITFDNGLEFTRALDLDEKGIKIYYAFPYSPWQRGINENWNGFLRRWFPKGTDFTKVAKPDLADATRRINEFEREILNNVSSIEVLNHYAKMN